jgi:hypothetical protein
MNAQQQFNMNQKIENMKRKPGRPPVEGSMRQERMMMLEEKRNENFGIMPLGRPVNPDSNRQQKLSELMERRESGMAKRGRPKMTEQERATAKLKREQDMATLAMLRTRNS